MMSSQITRSFTRANVQKSLDHKGHAACPRPHPGTYRTALAAATAEAIAQEMNSFLRGWAAHFRYGHSARRFSKIRQYARMRQAKREN